MKRSSIRRYSTWSSSRPFICRTRNGDAKNLFVRDDKKRNYYLITVKGDKRVDFEGISQAACLRALSFCLCGGFACRSGLIPGAVSPLGILNDIERRVHVYLDRNLPESKIGVHPNDKHRNRLAAGGRSGWRF